MTEGVLQSLATGLPVLVLHFGVTITMLMAGVAVYVKLTPHDEFRLIREGNIAAAISLSGACLGLAIPLAFCMSVSVNVLDIILWGLAALVIQIVSYRVADWLLKDLSRRISDGETGPAVFLLGVKLSVAVINGAAVAG